MIKETLMGSLGERNKSTLVLERPPDNASAAPSVAAQRAGTTFVR